MGLSFRRTAGRRPAYHLHPAEQRKFGSCSHLLNAPRTIFMRIDVIGKHMEVTDAIRQYALQKADKLTKFFDGVQLITVRLEEATHKHTKTFHVEITVDVVKHEDFVANSEGTDLYHGIDEAVDKASRQLTTFKEKLKQSKRGATPAGG
jgi:putative sigma-54 modulation protein